MIMKLRKEIAYTIVAKTMYDCRYDELSKKAREAVVLWWEDNEEMAYNIWKKGHRIWRKAK